MEARFSCGVACRPAQFWAWFARPAAVLGRSPQRFPWVSAKNLRMTPRALANHLAQHRNLVGKSGVADASDCVSMIAAAHTDPGDLSPDVPCIRCAGYLYDRARTVWYSQKSAMADHSLTIRLDAALKAAFIAMARERGMSVPQVLRMLMRDAVARHAESAAHDRWQRREVDDAMREAAVRRDVGLANALIEEDWRRRKAELGYDDH